jgi:hypothetical protein
LTEPTPAPTETEPQEPTPEPKPTETVDFWKAKAREQEKRAKDNADAARRLAEIEEANKTETQKAADRLAAAEREAATARQEALRLRVAARFQISDEDADLFLTGADEPTLTKQAERLAGREQERRKNGNHVPREGYQPPPAGDSEGRQTARALFGGAP